MAFKHKIIKAQKEFDNGKIDRATWKRVLNLTYGDEDKAKYKYIELRALEMDYESKSATRELSYWIPLIGLVWLAFYLEEDWLAVFILFCGVVLRIVWAIFSYILDWYSGGKRIRSVGDWYTPTHHPTEVDRIKLENKHNDVLYLFVYLIVLLVFAYFVGPLSPHNL